MAWYVYMLCCADKSLYTGVTNDIERRMAEHNGLTVTAGAKGAKYTKARRPVTLVYQESVDGRGPAQSREAALRRLSRAEKQSLINTHPK